MSNTVTNISQGLRAENIGAYLNDEDKGKLLEDKLTSICHNLAEIGALTDHKADLEFLLMVVGSYLIGNQDGTLTDDVTQPHTIFTENLLPMLDNMEEVEVEEIEEDGD